VTKEPPQAGEDHDHAVFVRSGARRRRWRAQNKTEERGMRREEGGRRRRRKDRGRRMEDSRQDLRTECRGGGAVVGFGRIWPCISEEGGGKIEE
jgi:hypothetical protein